MFFCGKPGAHAALLILLWVCGFELQWVRAQVARKREEVEARKRRKNTSKPKSKKRHGAARGAESRKTTTTKRESRDGADRQS